MAADTWYSGTSDWQNMFAITRFRYDFEVLFYIFYFYWGKKIFRYTEEFVI